MASTVAPGLRAGYGRADVTPHIGATMGGYWGRPSGASEIGSPLYVRALVLRNATTEDMTATAGHAATSVNTACVLSFDLIGLDRATADRVRDAVAAAIDGPRHAVMVACTHTHTGPLTHCGFVGMGVPDASYVAGLAAAAVEAAATAATEASTTAVTVAYSRCDMTEKGSASSTLSPAVPTRGLFAINRRQRRDDTAGGEPASSATRVSGFEAVGRTTLGQNPRGPFIPYGHVACFRRRDSDGIVATLFSYACHPVCVGKGTTISADFCGVACAKVEEATGAPALFVNGACGDVNPRERGGGMEAAAQAGALLGDAVNAALALASPLGPSDGAATPLCAACDDVALPLQPPATLEEAAAAVAVHQAELEEAEKGAATTGASVDETAWALLVPHAMLKHAQRQLAVAEAAAAPRSAPAARPPAEDLADSRQFLLQAINVGHLVLVGMEGEMFSKYQLVIEEAASRRRRLDDTAGSEGWTQAAMLCGYANGCVGYVPTADEFEWGGYEVEVAHKVYGHVRNITPESEARIHFASGRLVQAVAPDPPAALTGSTA